MLLHHARTQVGSLHFKVVVAEEMSLCRPIRET